MANESRNGKFLPVNYIPAPTDGPEDEEIMIMTDGITMLPLTRHDLRGTFRPDQLDAMFSHSGVEIPPARRRF